MEKLLKAAELAEKLNLNTETIYRLAKARKIPHVTVGRSKRFDLAAVMAAMQPAPRT
jgi:excisionase family DNA binding protein